MEFRANNTKESIARACEDILAEKLFSSKVFTLMEKRLMDRIARQHGFSEFDTADPKQVARLGKILNVEKILVGSITYLDSYKIDVRSIGVSTGEIDISVSKKISSLNELEGVLTDIALYIERHYLGYFRLHGKFDISAEMLVLSPVGVLEKAAGLGAGAQVSVIFNRPFPLPLDAQFASGYFYFTPKMKSVEYISMVPVTAGAAMTYHPARNIRFIPSVAIGYIFSWISFDKIEERTNSIYSYSRHFYYNPCVVLRSEIDVFLSDRWYLAVSPQYGIFFEPSNAGQFFAMALGLKMLF